MKANLRFFDTNNMIDRSGVEALIPEDASREIIQGVPKYSAVKVNGKKLYEYARNNIDVVLPKKEVSIYDISLVDYKIENNKTIVKFKCLVSKGTYIRSLIRDIGHKLGTVAVMNSLTRTRLGNFSLQDAYSIDDIKNKRYKLTSIIDAFPLIQRIVVNDDMAFKIKNGCVMEKFFDNDLAFILDKNNKLLALYKNIDNNSKAYRVFQ